ncbi:MAG: hypothetical protein COB14_09305 [Alphaproteobacteria bacterium]|nr:MAG: hypothetical protein COB14_09305 [Alphaproteobacteria bacterium]
MTNSTHQPGELKDMFETSHHGNGLSLEEITHNYYVAAKMEGNDDSSTGGLRINQSGRNSDAFVSDDKGKKATRDFLLMTMLNDMDTMEANLVDKYGEDFAENLAAEHLDEETYMRLMAIDNQDERRAAIAEAINDGIKNGTIDAGSIDNPDMKDWLDARSQEQQQRASIDISSDNNLESVSTVNNPHDTQENTSLSAGLGNFFS